MNSAKISSRCCVYFIAMMAVSVFGTVAWGQTSSCTVFASPGSVDLVSEAQSGLGFTVGYDEGECFWKVTAVVDDSGNPIDWLTVTAYSWLLGSDHDDTVTYSVTENDGFDRTGYIWIDGQQVFQVNQAGACTVTWEGAPTAGEVFVAYPACGAIAKVSGADATVLFAEPDVANYQGLVYGPDGMLYALDATRGRIDKFNPETGDGPVNVYDRDAATLKVWPAFARFNQTGALIVSGADSANNPVLYMVGSSVPIWVGSEDYEDDGSLGGITFDADGAILAVLPSTGEVLRFPPPDTAAGNYGSPSPVISSLANALGDARTANRDVFVATGSGLQWYEESTGATGPTWAPKDTCFGGQVLDVEQTADDTLNLTVWDSTNGVGQLWEVPFGWDPCEGETQYDFFCGGATLLATFGAPSGSGPAAVGVALPFTGREAFTGVGASYCGEPDYEPVQGSKPADLEFGQSFNFFDAFVEFIPSPVDAPGCRVTVSSTEHSPFEIEDVITNEAALQPSTPLVLPGDNGRMRVFEFLAEPGVTCPLGDADGDPLYTRNISAFFKEVNPKLALCHADGLTDCNLQLMSTLDLEFGNIPDDGKIGGFDPQFSEAFLVDQVPPGGYDGVWCGIDPPVENQEPWLQANAGSVVPIDIKPVPEGKACGDKTIPDLVAVLNVWYIPANGDPAYQVPFEDLMFTGNGSGSDYRAQFYEPHNPRRPYSLNWDTNDRNGDPLPTGDYKLTIFDDTAATLGVDKVYFPPQSVHIILK